MNITFIQTGGTIDKDYPKKVKGWGFEIGQPASDRILKKLNPSFEYEVVTLFKKDSLELTEENWIELLSFIKKHSGQIFIITHGTDTMIETGLFLAENIKDKVVIITGAMLPERFSNSDAPINLGVSIGSAMFLSHGIYVAMHGIVKLAKHMNRDLESGKFY